MIELRNASSNEWLKSKPDTLVQAKLYTDPQKQEIFYETCVMFSVENNCIFQAMENLDIVLSGLCSNNRLPVQIKSRKALSRNVSSTEKMILKDIFEIVSDLKKKHICFFFHN